MVTMPETSTGLSPQPIRARTQTPRIAAEESRYMVGWTPESMNKPAAGGLGHHAPRGQCEDTFRTILLGALASRPPSAAETAALPGTDQWFPGAWPSLRQPSNWYVR